MPTSNKTGRLRPFMRDARFREIAERLSDLPTQRMGLILVRCVGLLPLIESGEPDYLLTTGEPDRFNTKGVKCIYFAEDERTARAEHRCQMQAGLHQPVCLFFAEVNLERVLDLSKATVRKWLGITPKDLRAAWER